MRLYLSALEGFDELVGCLGIFEEGFIATICDTAASASFAEVNRGVVFAVYALEAIRGGVAILARYTA